MNEYFTHMFEYNDWANRLIIKVIKDLPDINPRIFSIFSHTIIAQIIWLNRLKHEPDEFKDFWQLINFEKLMDYSQRSTADWISIISKKGEEGLRESCLYKNSKGVQYSNTLAQIITHVTNHSTYHRGQIASLLRAENIQPPLTDYIAYFR